MRRICKILAIIMLFSVFQAGFSSAASISGDDSDSKKAEERLGDLTGGIPAAGVGAGKAVFKLGNLAVDSENISGENYWVEISSCGF